MIQIDIVSILVVAALFWVLYRKGEQQMAAIDEILAAVTAVSTTLDEVKADIATLISQLPGEGGLTAEQVAEVKTALEAVQAKATDAADDFPVPPTEPPTEPPA